MSGFEATLHAPVPLQRDWVMLMRGLDRSDHINWPFVAKALVIYLSYICVTLSEYSMHTDFAEAFVHSVHLHIFPPTFSSTWLFSWCSLIMQFDKVEGEECKWAVGDERPAGTPSPLPNDVPVFAWSYFTPSFTPSISYSSPESSGSKNSGSKSKNRSSGGKRTVNSPSQSVTWGDHLSWPDGRVGTVELMTTGLSPYT